MEEMFPKKGPDSFTFLSTHQQIFLLHACFVFHFFQCKENIQKVPYKQTETVEKEECSECMAAGNGSFPNTDLFISQGRYSQNDAYQQSSELESTSVCFQNSVSASKHFNDTSFFPVQ